MFRKTQVILDIDPISNVFGYFKPDDNFLFLNVIYLITKKIFFWTAQGNKDAPSIRNTAQKLYNVNREQELLCNINSAMETFKKKWSKVEILVSDHLG